PRHSYAQGPSHAEFRESIAQEVICLGSRHATGVDHPRASVSVICTTRGLYSRYQARRAVYVCTTHNGTPAAVSIPPRTMEDGVFINNTGLLCGQCSDYLKY